MRGIGIMIKYNFICDLEFTDSDPMKGQILECALLVTDLNLNVINEFCVKVRPEVINNVTWSNRAQEIHKITPEMAMSHPYSRREFCLGLLNFLAPYYYECNEPQPFVCHALDFGFKDSWPMIDFHMLEWSYRYEKLEDSFHKIITQTRVLSTITMARESGLFVMQKSIDKNGRESNRKSYKLKLLCPLVGFVLDHHIAKSDAYGCLEIYRYCRKQGVRNEKFC